VADEEEVVGWVGVGVVKGRVEERVEEEGVVGVLVVKAGHQLQHKRNDLEQDRNHITSIESSR
jgi:hypothetical protein